MNRSVRIAALLAPLAVAACAVPQPTGPTVMALPKQGEDFSVFQRRDASCRNYAHSQIGYRNPSDAATQSAVGSAVVGTALGAAAGAAVGAATGNVGAGAAIGGAGGLLVGGAVGADNARASSGSMQHRYDQAYTQCMVAGGYSVQGNARPVVAYPAYPPYQAYPAYAPGYYYAAPPPPPPVGW